MKQVVLWGPVVLVMALIFFASSLSDPGAPPGGISDKAAHFLIYGALGGALIRALAGGRPAAMTPRLVLVATVLAAFYGVTDEIHQYFVPPRTPDPLDVAADVAGALTGAIVIALLGRLLAAVFRRTASPRS